MKLIEKLPENRKEKFKEFNRFLKDKNIYKAYYRNIYNSRGDINNSFYVNYGGNMEEFFSKCPVNLWIEQCFIWMNQPEGNAFWNNIHKIWNSKQFFLNIT